MSEQRNMQLFLNDIYDSIQAIESFIEGMTLEEFSKDRKSFSATIRELEVIGEAVTNIPDKIKQRYPHILWQEIKSFRNKIVHEYFGIDIRMVWDVVKNELPLLKEQIFQVQTELEG
ncbi:HepT-like ribonuclease domain-containing protein [Desulfatirhabdium butyrativorans]|uniref:HepT-like ribonuclease domain-containing protein n=1 Tax=Desulfatirhabdium butyrativorans TaxID=340467 RepID=UPI000417204F|nr:DUF86 domain-containing protein [Desulfatirhabdium butyrativorans]